MTVGARYSLSCLPLFIPLPVLLPLTSFHPPSFYVLPLSPLSPQSFPSPSLVSMPAPKIQLMGLGERCKLPQWAYQTLLVSFFQAEIRALFHFHDDTFVIFTVRFGCVQRRHNKIPVGATWGHRRHNLLALGRSPPSPL